MEPDFLEAIRPDQGARVLGRFVPRARLGLHLRLGEISDRAEQALRRGDTAAYSLEVAGYLHLYGISPWRWRLGKVNPWLVRLSLPVRWPGPALQDAYEILVELNRLRWTMAFMEPDGHQAHPLPCDYSGRSWAWYCHKLASRYGWSTAEIYALWPEEAMAYLQEILISELDEAEERRSLSEVAYSYDKATKKAVFHPLPRPGWMVPRKPEPKIRVRKSWLPMGTVIKLNGG